MRVLAYQPLSNLLDEFSETSVRKSACMIACMMGALVLAVQLRQQAIEALLRSRNHASWEYQ